MHVDTFTTLASAGVPDDISSASAIHAARMTAARSGEPTWFDEQDAHRQPTLWHVQTRKR
ncbi:hypothetical protein [Curtobacterium sp. MCBD17_023]|uniref:hypothetical protein n=1 Tax=Curtobacterium sp. MCBD17_023 TaxID=2175657 RepID=UPI000D960826|nr:hypothetical protein [Curtobacterium sp. MCBD17_023]PYY49687.1 hypothetical protein DEI84_08540 [Curtobacterium sp. MCBD17_023]